MSLAVRRRARAAGHKPGKKPSPFFETTAASFGRSILKDAGERGVVKPIAELKARKTVVDPLSRFATTSGTYGAAAAYTDSGMTAVLETARSSASSRRRSRAASRSASRTGRAVRFEGVKEEEMEEAPLSDTLERALGDEEAKPKAAPVADKRPPFDATKWKHEPRKENPMYATSASSIGSKPPSQNELPTKYFPHTNRFTKSFNGMRYRDFGLATGLKKSRYHDALDLRK
eukprot:PLAT5897.1.p1 GENE.PLAT5897.1~~PLAT5897.1.p1  ORF type:complete len:231 (+),score=79.29 PLAT5897.1:209-901(+)